MTDTITTLSVYRADLAEGNHLHTGWAVADILALEDNGFEPMHWMPTRQEAIDKALEAGKAAERAGQATTVEVEDEMDEEEYVERGGGLHTTIVARFHNV